MIRRLLIALLVVAFSSAIFSQGWADEKNGEKKKEIKQDEVKAEPQSGGTSARGIDAGSPQSKPKHPPYGEVLADAQTIEGFIKLHRKDGQLFAELSPDNLNKDMIVAIAISRGIGQAPLVGGMTWDFDDTWVWQFRKVDDRIQIVRRNVRFRALHDTPQERAVQLSYTDSILFSLPIVTTSPNGNYVVNLNQVFMSDLPQFSSVLHGFNFAGDRSTWSQVKGFRDNVELEVAATYASGGASQMDTVADSRGATIYVHYSVSRLIETGYQPRLADDRVGHFVTAIRDFSKTGEEDQFVRYVDRWDLRKAEPSAEISPPVKPIIFWIEKTVPFKFRAAVRDGMLEWNKAFEKAGFSNAIEVRQQPDDATWDPEDINYNTFRWITSNAGFAMGPSRMNPMTGQLLYADIICDASFIEVWINKLEIGSPANKIHDMLNGNSVLEHAHNGCCNCANAMSQQLAFASIALADGGKPISKEQIDKLLVSGLKMVVMHEVGHTLGLRHNFKASGYWSMTDLNNPEKTQKVGLTASVMDYMPVNISPKGKPQGEYFSSTIGPYDYWAIEYAYKPLKGGTDGEVAELKKIASRCTEPALQYATDEDAMGPDPLVNRFDLSSDTIEFAKWRVELTNQLMSDLIDRVVKTGDGYSRARHAFEMLFSDHTLAMSFVAKYIGGVSVYRNHKGDPNARSPYVGVDPKKQREALQFLDSEVFGVDAYRFPTKLYDYLGSSHWSHWGMHEQARPDFPIHQIVLQGQTAVLNQILSPATLSRIIDSELKTPAKQDAFTAPELLHGLTAAIFSETDKLQNGKFTNREPAVSSLRRNLQRLYFEKLANLVIDNKTAPADCQAVAAAELTELEARLQKVFAGKAQPDDYTRAHLSELSARIRKVLDARLNLPRP